ncbi:MAG: hypothetical protein M3065_06295 [Actinomycetota bacterium]|nr:hypothetical protein [Actinomycetota bacterium]
MTAAELLAAIEALSASELVAVLDMASLTHAGDDPVARLGSGQRMRLARALRRVTSASPGGERKQA